MDSYKVKAKLQIKGDDRQFTYKFVIALATNEDLEAYIHRVFSYYEIIKYTYTPISNLMVSDTCIVNEFEKLKRQAELDKLAR